MQHHCGGFRTDEAILSPDWIPKECVITVYGAASTGFYYTNRAYASYRKTLMGTSKMPRVNPKRSSQASWLP